MKKPTLKTRKPIDELVPGDLTAFPIWEFASDEECEPGRDETWVRPVKSRVIERGNHSLSVAADFVTASGRKLVGFMSVSTAHLVDIDLPVLLASGKYIFVKQADPERRKAVALALGMAETEVFPLEFQLRVLLEGEAVPRRGVVFR